MRGGGREIPSFHNYVEGICNEDNFQVLKMPRHLPRHRLTAVVLKESFLSLEKGAVKN